MKDTGGPAFPLPGELGLGLTPKEMRGMTLRDWFAGMAMQAHITHEGSDDINEPGVARWAYEMADAMLAERSEP